MYCPDDVESNLSLVREGGCCMFGNVPRIDFTLPSTKQLFAARQARGRQVEPWKRELEAFPLPEPSFNAGLPGSS